MTSAKCPHNEQLAAYLSGRLEEGSAQSIADHVETCPQCEETISDLEKFSDTIGKTGTASAGQTNDAANKSLGMLGHYELLEELGRGGMGAVYKAKHTRLRRVVALKVLPASLLQDESAIARFDREMHAVGQLDHPNIVRASDAGEVDGTHYLVMELVKGDDLSVVARRRGPLPVADACELVRQAAVGLQHAMDNGLVHRDIKPSNLMLTRDGHVKILDMGLALLDTPFGADDGLTSTGQMMGTVDYMAPEQVTDSHSVDIRADIYSLGCTIYRLLSGSAPFEDGKYDNVVYKAMAHVDTPPPPLGERRPDLPPELITIIDKALAKKPDERFQTPADFAEALAPLAVDHNLPELIGASKNVGLESSSRETPTIAPVKRSTGPAPGIGSSRQAVAPDKPRFSPPRRVIIAAGLGGFAALLGLIVLLLPNSRGTIRIEINDPSVEVSIKGTSIQIKGGGQELLQLAAGEHTLHVESDGLEFDTETLVLKKGETIAVRVQRLQGGIQATRDGRVIGQTELPVAESSSPSLGTTESPIEIPVASKADIVGNALTPEFGSAELLPLVDKDHDVITGDWLQLGDGSWQSGKLAYSRLQFPVIPRGNYELRVRFVHPSSNKPTMVILPAGSTQIGLVVGGGEKANLSGIGLIRDKGFMDNETTMDSVKLIQGKIHELKAEVSVIGSNVRVRASLDGTEFVNWFGPSKVLRLDESFVLFQADAIGLASDEGVVEYRRATLKMLSGKAELLRDFEREQLVQHSDFLPYWNIRPEDGWMDLFPLIDVSKDAVEGAWKKEGDVIRNEGGYFLRLRVPVRIRGSYEFRAVFNQDKWVPNFQGWGLPMGTDRIGLRVKEHTSAGAVHFGIHGLPSAYWGEDPKRIVSGQDHVLTVRVQTIDEETKIEGALDGQPLASWSGKWLDSMNGLKTYYFAGGVADEPLIVVRKGLVRLKGAQLRMLDGHAVLLRPSDQSKLKPAEPIAIHKSSGNIDPAKATDSAAQLDAPSTRGVTTGARHPPVAKSPDYLRLVRDFADCMLEYGRDRYGEVHSPLFASALTRDKEPTLLPYPKWERAPESSNYFNLNKDNPNEWFYNYFQNLPQRGDDSHKNGVVGEDMQDNASLYLLLLQLSEVTGDSKYASEAKKAISWWIINTQSPTTGLFPWGEHLCWDFRHDDVSYSSGPYKNLFSRRYHEGKGPYVIWEHFASIPAQNREGYWRDDLRPIERYAVGLWNQHIWNKEKIYWDRHGDYFYPMNVLPKRGDGAFPWVIEGCYRWWGAAYATSQNAKFKEEISDVMRRTLRGLLVRQKEFGFLPWSMKNERHYESQNRSMAVAIYEAADRIAVSDKQLASELQAGADKIFETSGGKAPAVDRLDLDYARSVVDRNIMQKAVLNAGYTVTYLGTLARAWRETGDRAFLNAWDDKARVCVNLFFDDKCPLPKSYYKDTLPIGRKGEHGRFQTHYSAEWGCSRLMKNLLELHVETAATSDKPSVK